MAKYARKENSRVSGYIGLGRSFAAQGRTKDQVVDWLKKESHAFYHDGELKTTVEADNVLKGYRRKIGNG